VTNAQNAIDAAMQEAERLRQLLRKGKSKQVSGDDDRQVIKATALTWFNNHRAVLILVLKDDLVKDVDESYRGLLTGSEKATLRTRHLAFLKRIKQALGKLQSDQVVLLSVSPVPVQNTSDAVPPFAPLVVDAAMQQILANRWKECIRCVEVEAPLAATVMMGGLVEALLLARINQLADKASIINAKTAPKDRKTGKTLNLKEWGLKDYIAVAHEVSWISPTTKDVGTVLMEYRNYIHPQKEHSHGVSISTDDAKTLWEIAKSISRQVLKP
jgi:hypothetical protein